MQVEKECQSQIKSIRNRSVSYHQIWQRWLPPCSSAILFMITTLLCCYVGDCSTMQGLVMALFIDWPERDGSLVFYNITSHHITLIEQNISLGSPGSERQDNAIIIFSTLPFNLKNICFLSHTQSRQQSRQMWCTVGAPSAGTSTQRNTLNSAGWSSSIFACLFVLHDLLIWIMTKEC